MHFFLGVHGISSTTSIAAISLKKKHQKDAEKAQKLKEKMLVEKAKKAAVTASNKRKSSDSTGKAGGNNKRKKSLESVAHIDVVNMLEDVYVIADPTVRDNVKENSESRGANYDSLHTSGIEKDSNFEIEKAMDSDDDLWDDCYHHSQ